MGADKRPERGHTFVRGAMVLGAAAIVSKLIGTLQKIPLQNLAGDYVFGIYNAVYPLYTMIVLLATAGFPIAVSRFVAEQLAAGNAYGARLVLRRAMLLSTAAGIGCFVLLYGGADRLAAWIGDGETAAAIRAIAFALLLVPSLASIRGYFQGIGDMVPTAVSQVTEQVIRVAVMLIGLLYLLGQGASEAAIAAGATFGSTAGAAAGLVTVIWYIVRAQRQSGAHAQRHAAKSLRSDTAHSQTPVRYRTLLAYAVPICLGAIVVPLLTLVDTFMIPRLLIAQGMTDAAAMAVFGLYNHGLPLVQLVTMIVSSVSVVIVPVVAAAKMRGEYLAIQQRAGSFLSLIWLVGLAATVGIGVLARPIHQTLYGTADGAHLVVILGLTTVWSALQIAAAAVLQGVGAERVPVYHLIAAIVLKVMLNAVLVPHWGAEGAAWAAVIAYAAAALLNMAYLQRKQWVRLQERHWIGRPLLAAALMACGVAAIAAAWEWGWNAQLGSSSRLSAALLTLLAVGAGVYLYALVLLRLRLITQADLETLPKGDKLLRLLRRWRMLPTEGEKR